MTAKYIWELGSLIFVILGSIHLFYTFFTDKFHAKDKTLVASMKISSPILTGETTMWKAWIGFNASHSGGAIFIGVINLFLVDQVSDLVFGQPFFFCFNILTVGFYLWLASKYWFKIPFYGILIALSCFIIAFLIS